MQPALMREILCQQSPLLGLVCLFSRKMTLYEIHWKIFDVDPKEQMTDFTETIKKHVSAGEVANPTTSLDSSTFIKKRGGRLNTKLRQQVTVEDFGTEGQPQIGNFWDRYFSGEDEVPWYKFQKSFLDDYEARLTGEKFLPLRRSLYLWDIQWNPLNEAK